MGPRLREFFRRVEAETVSNSRNKILISPEQVPRQVMEAQSSAASVITALKGRTHVHFQPSPPDTSAMALSPSSPPSSPASSAPLAMTSTWQQRLPSWSIPGERHSERAFRPPERTESQKYDAWKDIFQRAEHYKNNFRKVPGELSRFERILFIFKFKLA